MNKTMYRTLLPVLLVLPLTPLWAQQDASTAGGDKVQLQVHPTKGQSAWFRTNIQSVQNIDMGAQKMEMKNDITWTFSATFTEVPAEGLPVVEYEIAGIKGQLTLPMMGDVKFDSATPSEGDDVAAAMTSVVGTRFKATVSPAGKVTLTDDAEEALAAARENAGGMASQMLMGVLNPGTIQHLADSAFGPLPEKPVAAGDAWEHGEKAGGGRAPVASKLKMTLDKLNGDQAEISATGTIVAASPEAGGDDDKDQGEEAAMAREMMKDMKVEDGKISGKMVWSRKDGMAVSSSSDMTMTMTMPGPMGGDMKIQQTQKVRTERTTKEAAKPAAATDKK